MPCDTNAIEKNSKNVMFIDSNNGFFSNNVSDLSQAQDWEIYRQNISQYIRKYQEIGALISLKIVLSLWRGAIFDTFASRAREAEIASQMVPKSSLKRPPEAPEWPKMSLQIGARILINFQLRF